MTRKENLSKSKEHSLKFGSKKIVLNDGSKEFFHYINGELTEYDCMNYHGNQVLLNKEELSVIESGELE